VPVTSGFLPRQPHRVGGPGRAVGTGLYLGTFLQLR